MSRPIWYVVAADPGVHLYIREAIDTSAWHSHRFWHERLDTRGPRELIRLGRQNVAAYRGVLNTAGGIAKSRTCDRSVTAGAA